MSLLTSAAAPVISAAADSDVGPGGGAFLVFILLAVAAAGLCWALSRSLKTLRKRVDNGTFDATAKREFEEHAGRSASHRRRDDADA